MNLLETFSESEAFAKHPPKDILLFVLVLASVLNLYLYFKLVNSGGKTEIVINSDSGGEVAGAKSQIPVYVSGAVNFPGVYLMESGSLISDVLRAAGGFSSAANAMWVSKNLNLSEGLKENSKIYVPFGWDSEYLLAANVKVVEAAPEEGDKPDTAGETGDDDATTDAAKVNVNTATLSELDELSGIGPVYAQRIIDNRPYSDFDDFKAKSGLSENLANSLSEYVRFN